MNVSVTLCWVQGSRERSDVNTLAPLPLLYVRCSFAKTIIVQVSSTHWREIFFKNCLLIQCSNFNTQQKHIPLKCDNTCYTFFKHGRKQIITWGQISVYIKMKTWYVLTYDYEISYNFWIILIFFVVNFEFDFYGWIFFSVIPSE